MNKNVILMSSIATVLFIPLTISYIVISYVKTLEKEKCNCSEDIRRKYLKYYGYSILLLSIVGLFVIIFAITNPKLFIFNTIIKYLSLFISFLGVYIMYSYGDLLESNECKCADSWKRIFLKYYAYFMLGIISLTFMVLIVIFIYHIASGDELPIIVLKRAIKNC